MIGLFAALSLAIPGTDPGEGRWRQLIAFNPTAEMPDGTSLFLLESDMLPGGAPRSLEVRRARQLWVNHGVAVGEQAWAAIDSNVDCNGGITLQTVQAYDSRGRLLGEARPDEKVHAVPHSAEHLVFDAVCLGSPYLYSKPVVSSAAEATGDATTADGPDPSVELQWDVDYDGRPDILRIHMRPHSMRHDVEFILARDPTRPINVVTAHQPPTGPLVERRIRPLNRDRYLIVCRMVEGRDVDACVPGYPLVQRGVEVVTEGHPTILVWLVGGEPHVARLPMAD
jgi:hypothetical protein